MPKKKFYDTEYTMNEEFLQVVVHKVYKPIKQRKWQTFKNRRRPQYMKDSVNIQNPVFLPYHYPVPGYYGNMPGYFGAGYGCIGYPGPGYICNR